MSGQDIIKAKGKPENNSPKQTEAAEKGSKKQDLELGH